MIPTDRRQPRYWLWWWRSQTSFEVRSTVAVLVVALLGLTGYLAAASLAGWGGPASGAEESLVETLTLEHVVTLTRGGERAPDAASVLGTAAELVTLPTAGRPRTVVQAHDRTTRTRVVTSVRVVTRERVVTAERTVRQPVTATRVFTETLPVTETLRSTDTVRVTDTVSMPVTVTVEVPVTVTVTVPPGKTK